MIPLFVDFSGKKVVIFGGGDVAARKAALFSREAPVLVVSRSLSPALREIPCEFEPCELRACEERKIREFIEGAFLVIATLPDPVINDVIGVLCREEGILFNNASGVRGDVLVPSVIRGANFTIGIGTDGMSPAISRYIRELIERECPDLDGMIALQQKLRYELRSRVPRQEDRRRILWEVLHDQTVRDALAQGKDAAWDLVERRYLHA